MAKPKKLFRVELVNRQTLGARCGYGEGRTLQEAQQNAIAIANQTPNAHPILTSSGYQCWFSGGVNC